MNASVITLKKAPKGRRTKARRGQGPNAEIIDFRTAYTQRHGKPPRERRERTREELLQIGRDAYNANPKAYYEWALDQIIEGFGWFD